MNIADIDYAELEPLESRFLLEVKRELSGRPKWTRKSRPEA
jgi:hypothetical protein